jgi:hypothetical protein
MRILALLFLSNKNSIVVGIQMITTGAVDSEKISSRTSNNKEISEWFFIDHKK